MPNPAPAPKWWIASRTIWGAFITALATILPALGPLLGFSLPPELVQELGDQVVVLVQAVAAVAGTAAIALAWIIGIARNHAIDVIRSRSREAIAPHEIDLEAADPAAHGGIEAVTDLGAVGRCLASLDDGPRRAIVLAYRDGLSHEELAAVLGAPLGTVKSWVSRGLARLRLCLDNRR